MIRAYDKDWAGNKTVETCQSGTLEMYNTSTTPTSGLFDAKLQVISTPDPEARGSIYHFTCTYTTDEPHTGTCTLTFQEPPKKVGPALVSIHLRDVAPVDGVCIAASATIVGNYFYDSRQVAAGVYAFYAPAH
eukprot:CAMPEP_0119394828 /NCGR_PEP_ID=MMETSP1334-20130426/130915_1 /TAXON_ID=127549 /ORGANISM="Calcidiscus leptoporus, Strain RCC1130" /LENGTH=132 /DNA_ID=CAMNT_0007418185 /DNA_START=150 /DNA_END=548 /DNA_ORIENTATION=-